MQTVLQQLNSALADVAGRVQRGIVQVRSGRHGAGTGIVLAGDGLVLTNAHVVRRGALQVRLPEGGTQPARVVRYDPQLDLAVLRVAASGLPVLGFGESQRLRPGAWVMAVGYPWGVAGAATAGVLLGFGRGRGSLRGRDWLVADLHLRPGHSGGPLVDAEGRVVGVNTMVVGPDVGVAVPAHVARRFVERAGTSEAA